MITMSSGGNEQSWSRSSCSTCSLHEAAECLKGSSIWQPKEWSWAVEGCQPLEGPPAGAACKGPGCSSLVQQQRVSAIAHGSGGCRASRWVLPALQRHWTHIFFSQKSDALWVFPKPRLGLLIAIASLCPFSRIIAGIDGREGVFWHPRTAWQEALSSSLLPGGTGRAPIPFIQLLACSVASQNFGGKGILKACSALRENQKHQSHF